MASVFSLNTDRITQILPSVIRFCRAQNIPAVLFYIAPHGLRTNETLDLCWQDSYSFYKPFLSPPYI